MLQLSSQLQDTGCTCMHIARMEGQTESDKSCITHDSRFKVAHHINLTCGQDGLLSCTGILISPLVFGHQTQTYLLRGHIVLDNDWQILILVLPSFFCYCFRLYFNCAIGNLVIFHALTFDWCGIYFNCAIGNLVNCMEVSDTYVHAAYSIGSCRFKVAYSINVEQVYAMLLWFRLVTPDTV